MILKSVPEPVLIWGVPRVGDNNRTDTVLKFTRAREFKVKEATTMLKSAVLWRKRFDITSLLDADLSLRNDARTEHRLSGFFDRDGYSRSRARRSSTTAPPGMPRFNNTTMAFFRFLVGITKFLDVGFQQNKSGSAPRSIYENLL
jgi:hypothetical protein